MQAESFIDSSDTQLPQLPVRHEQGAQTSLEHIATQIQRDPEAKKIYDQIFIEYIGHPDPVERNERDRKKDVSRATYDNDTGSEEWVSYPREEFSGVNEANGDILCIRSVREDDPRIYRGTGYTLVVANPLKKTYQEYVVSHMTSWGEPPSDKTLYLAGASLPPIYSGDNGHYISNEPYLSPDQETWIRIQNDSGHKTVSIQYGGEAQIQNFRPIEDLYRAVHQLSDTPGTGSSYN